MKIYVSNLSYQTTETEIRAAFERFGTVSSVEIIVDQVTKQSKGSCFVVMNIDDEAKTAVEELDGSELGGRMLRVDEARGYGCPVKQNKRSGRFFR